MFFIKAKHHYLKLADFRGYDRLSWNPDNHSFAL